MSSFGVTEFNLAIEYALRVRGKEKLTLKQAQRHAIYQIVKSALSAMIKNRELIYTLCCALDRCNLYRKSQKIVHFRQLAIANEISAFNHLSQSLFSLE